MPYIKSHSNYVLRSKHQLVNDGTIWERDITTIGGVNQFSPGQTPIYRSGNFIITVRDDTKKSNQYNTTKWKSTDSGDVWTLETVENLVSEDERQNDTKIVLKQDYYDFRDFAYYGSLTELFRASVNDIINRFPGELYATDDNVYYTSAYTEDFERYDESVLLGDENQKYIVNPFHIDIHSTKLPDGAEPIKFFAEDGYKNYVIFNGNEYNPDNEEIFEITSWEVSEISNSCHRGDKVATVTINGNYVINVYIGENYKLYYLSEQTDFHIRPKKKFIDKFYNECDNFEYLLMNPKSTPLYQSTFSVIRENEYGYYRELVPFEFPKSKGGYNIDASDYGFNDYTNTMVEIGEYYDEHFSDNLYRSMTHEAIKNFDWTYTREFETGEEEEYVAGGQKMQKALRVFAREFDEILTYIDNIKNGFTVTYDERNNIPDYFLTDVLGNDGWDVKLVLPYDLTEYYYDENGDKQILDESNYTQGDCNIDGQFNNTETVNGTTYNIYREFTQLSKNIVKPYVQTDYENGYFITCDGDIKPCHYEGSKYYYKDNTENKSTWYDNGVLKNRIKQYTSPREYTYMDANNEFLRRLKINSRYIWRHKGTIEGIEMIMAMFGLKSKRWYDRLPDCDKKNINWDYDITEYTSFTYRIEEKWDAIHQMYRIEWVNSTKAINYDNRMLSNYTLYGANTNFISYQGIPVVYRDEYVYTDSECTGGTYSPYIKISELSPETEQPSTKNIEEAFKRVDENNAPVIRRYLYPNFDKNEQLDGNPYFQMDGGWFSKTINAYGFVHNFQYDVDNNIVATNYVSAGTVNEDDTIVDNEALYRETIRNIRRVDNVASLLKIPAFELYDGAVVYVTNIETNAAIIDNEVYEIKREWISDSAESGFTASYISLIVNGGSITVGGDKFFDSTIIVYDYNGVPITYDSIIDMPDGTEIKAYIKYLDNSYALFMCQEDEDGYYGVENFIILDEHIDVKDTNYFKLSDVNYSNVFATDTDSDGWRRLKVDDMEYLKINTIYNYYNGNNGHNGNMRYDSGHKYFTYFKRLFKDAIDNSRFDERCYIDYWKDIDEEIFYYGFKNLIEDNEKILQYSRFLNEDNKIHYFGNYKTPENDIFIYGENCERIKNFKTIYSGESNNVRGYILNDPVNTIDKVDNPYSRYVNNDESGFTVDEVTNQIMNNKNIKIRFNLHYDWYTKEGQEELKYIDDIVLSYLEQMIPSTVIVNVEYKNIESDCSCNSLRMWFKDAAGCDDISFEQSCDCNNLEITQTR